MLENWARAAGFAAILAVSLSASFHWALYYPPPSHLPSSGQEKSHPPQHQESGGGEPRGTEGSPFIVKVLPPPHGTPEASRDEYERNQKAAIDRGLLLFTGVLAIATIALMAATFGLVGFAMQQSRETKILQRAYIGVLPFGVHPFASNADRISCDVGFYNAGNLPARHVHWIIRRKFSTNKRLNDFPIEGNFVGDNVISPKITAPKGTISIPWSRIERYRSRGNGDDRWLYVWGRVFYMDGFGTKRCSDFCHRYNLAATDGHAIGSSAARYHEYGNDAD